MVQPVGQTFAPEDNGWHLQRGYTIQPRYNVDEDERELLNVTSVAITDRPVRSMPFVWRANTRAAQEYMLSFFNRHRGPAGRFYYQLPECVPSPDVAPSVSSVAGGTLGSRTYNVQFAWKSALGTTLGSPILNQAISANFHLVISFPPYPPGVTQAVIYLADTASKTIPEEQITVTNVTTWTEPDALPTAGNVAQATNTAEEKPLCRLVTGSFGITRGAGTTYEARATLEDTYDPTL